MFRAASIILIPIFFLGHTESWGKTAEQIFSEVAPSIAVVLSSERNTKESSQGTGVVVAPGIVATNCHLFKNPVAIVVLYQQNKYAAELAVQNRPRDLCILNVPTLRAPAVETLSQVKNLRVGQEVYAIGTPMGLELSLTNGLISSLRQVEGGTLIQISASMAPGSSGGGLFDSNGALIGITSSGIAKFQGFNFAIPVDWVAETLSKGIASTPISAPIAANPVPTPIATTLATAPPATVRREGDWIANRYCDGYSSVPTVKDELDVSFRDGEFTVETGKRGELGYVLMRGRQSSDGTLRLIGHQVDEVGVNNVNRHFLAEVYSEVKGGLDGERYQLKGRMAERTCTLTISRR